MKYSKSHKFTIWMFVTYPDIWGFLGSVLMCSQGKTQMIHSEIEIFATIDIVRKEL